MSAAGSQSEGRDFYGRYDFLPFCFHPIADRRTSDYASPMSADLLETIEAAFGWRGFPHGLFYQSQFGLRIELGGDRDAAPLRFLQALDRARVVAKALFSRSETLIAVVSIYGDERTTRRQLAALQQLERIGFQHQFGSAAKVPQNDQEYIAEFGSDLYRHWYAAEFTTDESSVSALLWASIAREMEIQPKARWADTIHLVDVRERLALTAYDDRGMDVIGPSAPALSSLYKQFSPWLLDYDRAEMDAKFSR
jgi:hypothetical protein